jgi:LCP family protein required for cell wall assembly
MAQQVSDARPERRPWLLRALLFRALPLILIAIGIYLGWLVAQRLSRYLEDQAAYQQLVPAFPGTATALALTPTPAAHLPGLGGRALAKPFDHGGEQVFVTNTPPPSAATPPAVSFATNTPVAVPTTPMPDVPTFDPARAVTPRPLPTLFIYNPGEVSSAAAPTAIPTPVPTLDRRGQDLMNIVLLGNDNEITGETVARTDTIIVVSINRTTGTVAMINFPRDLYVYIPGWTMQRINVAYPHGEEVGWTDGGFGLLRQTLLYNFGINVHYYAMVNLSGFRALVDAVGGVTLSVDCAIQDLPLIGAEVPRGAYPVADSEWVLPVGQYHMNGAEALWYARSRGNSSDFDRGRRQMQVLRAVWRQARENGLLANLPALWAEGSPYLTTSLTFEDILGLLPLAANLDAARIESFNLIRTYHTQPWQTPSGDYVQLPVYETLRPLLEDFYIAPTENQLNVQAATIAVYNGTTQPGLDAVAADRLAWDGFNAVAMGPWETTDYLRTTLIDYTGATKGSSLTAIARALNITPDDVIIDPRSDAPTDFAVIVGSTYNSCPQGGVLPVDPPLNGS